MRQAYTGLVYTGQMGAALFLVFALHVETTGSCPAAADVEARLAPLLASDAGSPGSEVGVVSESDDGGVAVSLLGGDGRPRFSRRLPRAATCADQAETVAVALAAWELEIHPAVALRLDRLAVAPPLVAPIAAEPTLRVAAPAPASPPLTLALGAAALIAVRPNLAPGARVQASLGTDGGRLRWQLSMTGLGNHEESGSRGQVSWWRVYLAGGPEVALPFQQRWQAAIGAGPVFGLASIAGTGFPVNRRAYSADLGAEAHLRVAVRWRRIAPWIGAATVWWVRRQTAVATGGQPFSLDLPSLEPMLQAGADFFSLP